MIRRLTFGVLVLAATSWAQSRPPIMEKIAKTYGLDSFEQIEAIRYTWNAQFPGVNVSRSWVWEPKTGKVSFEGKDKEGKPVKVTYVRSQLSSQPDNVKNEVDPGFNNDNYWLLFPLHAYWDTGATVTDQGMHKLPIGSGSAELVSVKYPNEGRLHARRHLGPLRRQRLPGRAVCLSSRRAREAECRHRNLGGLQESWPSPYLNRASRDGGRQAAASLLFGRGRQADGVRHVGKCEINKGREQKARFTSVFGPSLTT